MFKGNNMKAVTFSYDDGVKQDKRLIQLLNKYNLKCTFNLNSGLQTGASQWINNGVPIRRLNLLGLKEVYQGHEIAVHSLTHPYLEKQDIETIRNEIGTDKHNLEKCFGCSVQGMAYPYGTYDNRVIEVLKENSIQFARTVDATEGFDSQSNLLEFRPTCHHSCNKLMELADEFIHLKPNVPKIFYIWGHSYELDVDSNWDMFETFCKRISNREDIFYGTNSEVLLS